MQPSHQHMVDIDYCAAIDIDYCAAMIERTQSQDLSPRAVDSCCIIRSKFSNFLSCF